MTWHVSVFAADTPSTLDQLLEELQAIVDQYLPVLGPLFGLTDEQIAGVVANFDKFVADVEALEHGTVDVSTGVEDIVIDLIEILKALGIDDTLPSEWSFIPIVVKLSWFIPACANTMSFG